MENPALLWSQPTINSDFVEIMVLSFTVSERKQWDACFIYPKSAQIPGGK